MSRSKTKCIRFFKELGIDDVPLVGGKNASLGEMVQKLSEQGVRVPHGFAITAEAYRYMLDAADARRPLRAELDQLDPTDVTALARKGKRAREIVYGAGLPGDLTAEIIDAYRKLQEEYGEEVRHGLDKPEPRHGGEDHPPDPGARATGRTAAMSATIFHCCAAVVRYAQGALL